MQSSHPMPSEPPVRAIAGHRRRLATLGAFVMAGVLAFTPAATGIASSTRDAAPLPPDVLRAIEQLRARINAVEAQTLARVAAPPDNQVQQIELLGKALLYDEQLSVNRNEACAFCHMPETGFTGPISQLNQTTGAYPGSVRTRFSDRKPQTHSYAPLSPVLHFNAARGDMVGGNFWDMRATGRRLGNPAAEQAEGPPVNPVEMGLPDPACEVYRASQRPYRRLFEQVWGEQAFAITWPNDVEAVCNQPAPAPANDPLPVHLNAAERGIAQATFDQIAQSLAGYEASAEISPLSSKFDAYLGGQAQLTAQEKQGYDLFRGKARCNECHRDGGPGEDPLFTDFTASNIGTPANRSLPFYTEDHPDARGYVANTSGAAFVDLGVGAFLGKGHPLSQPSARDPRWVAQAGENMGRIQVPTLRNVDKRPDLDFIKAYGHNGYFKSLKEIVHFYNTRDTLPRCQPDDPGEGVSCWPAPETTAHMNTRFVGNLGLTGAEEDAIVAFLKALSDGWTPD